MGKWANTYLFFRRSLKWTIVEYSRYTTTFGMVGVGAQYLLMPLMSKYLRWSDTTILIVSFPFLFCSHLGHNNRAKNRRSHQARKEIGKLLFLHVKLKLDCFWIHTTILGRLYYTRTTAASSLCYVPKCKCLYSRSRRWDALWITLW